MKELVIVGTGIKTISHLTEEAKGYLASSDKVLYLINEPLLESYIDKISKSSESLSELYFQSLDRVEAYENISDKIISELEKEKSICVAIYGHPYVFSTPCLLTLNKAEEKGIQTTICSAVSSIDCLYSDLRIDPGNDGIQILDATEYILYDKSIDITSNLVICQIGMVGKKGLPSNDINLDALVFLKEKLIEEYGKSKSGIIYEAALYPRMQPKILRFKLEELDFQQLTPISTLFIPPVSAKRAVNPFAVKLIE